MSSVNYTTIDRIIRINDVIRDHLTLEENCSHSIREIITEAFEEGERKKVIGSPDPTSEDSSAANSQEESTTWLI